MGENKKQSEREDTCLADADELKYMMLLNTINEPNNESDNTKDANDPQFIEKGKSKS